MTKKTAANQTKRLMRSHSTNKQEEISFQVHTLSIRYTVNVVNLFFTNLVLFYFFAIFFCHARK